MDKDLSTWDSFAVGAKQFLNDVVFQYVPKLVVAAIVLFVGWKLINLLNKMMKRAYERHKVDPSLQEFLHSLIDIISPSRFPEYTTSESNSLWNAAIGLDWIGI